MCARVVLWVTGTHGLASMKHFASSPWNIFAAYFFNLGYSVFFRYFILQPEPTLDLYETNKNDSTSDTYV